jgi:hypothetical protein
MRARASVWAGEFGREGEVMRSVLRLAGMFATFALVSGYGSAPGAAASKLHLRALLANESGQTVGTFYERCDKGGAASSTVVLGKSMALKAGAILAIYKTADFNPIVSTVVGDKGGNVRHFSGANSSGCVDKGTGVALTMSPGGMQSTLLEVVGKGVVGDKRANTTDTSAWPWPWFKPAQ